LFWLNPDYGRAAEDHGIRPPRIEDILDAEARLRRFAPLLAKLFPQLHASGGLIESTLLELPKLGPELLGRRVEHGRCLLKADHELPIAGSVKARGGIYEVLLYAERLAMEAGLLSRQDDYTTLAGSPFRKLFARHTIAVGSTGNLGLGIGISATALGFRAVVHMSAEARKWKKELLRAKGVEVVEHSGDYAAAVAAGRSLAASDPNTYFIDDENSLALFLGYSTAALRLRMQLQSRGVRVDAEHPLFVYLPCGVGGAPGGITFGLKQLFGEHVHCFFAEPVAAPCMLVQLATEGDEPVSVYDVGLDNLTAADGLAVATASPLAAGLMRKRLSGIFTVGDEELFRCLYRLERMEGIRVEPSAAACIPGPERLLNSPAGHAYLQQHGLEQRLATSTHLLWTTGGSLVPEEEYARFHARGAHAECT
jgi:D-serine dehydratase